MQIKLGGKLSGDIKISDKIQPIKTEKKENDVNKDSLQASIKNEYASNAEWSFKNGVICISPIVNFCLWL